MRRTLSVLALASMAACSMTPGGTNAPVAGTPPAPVASSTLASTVKQLSPDALRAVSPELAVSMHYRRSDAVIKGFAPTRAFVEEVLVDTKAPASDAAQVRQVMDGMASIVRADVFVAAPTTPLKSLDDLEQLEETGCVATRWVVDASSPLATLLQTPPPGVEQQITPLKLKITKDSISVWSPGCEKMPAFATPDAVAQSGDALVGSASFVAVVQSGHALLHDPVLWAELTKKYREGVEESLARNEDAAVVRKWVDRFEKFAVRLNLWKVLRETNVVAQSWTFLPSGDWSMDVLVDTDTPAAAEILRRSTVGMLDAQILVLTDTASQEIQSVTEGSRAAINILYKNPDLSSFIAANGGASAISGLVGIAVMSMAQQRQLGMGSSYDYDPTYMGGGAPPIVDVPGMRPATIDWDTLEGDGASAVPLE